MQNYIKYMHRCIDLARNGKGMVAPNPMVGSVIVHNNKIIGEGYHRVFGGPHAEVNAINSVKETQLLPESTLYVNLEPCSHMGKTPPCSDLIIEKGLKKLVIGTTDPNSIVAGKGIEKLKNAGLEVVLGVLEEECFELNKRFFTFHAKKRPYIILKWAQSRDGYIDIDRTPGTPIGPNWISNPISRTLVHKWRSVENAIMVGTNSVVYDNPGLDTRYWPGKSPLRITVDRKARIPENAKLFNGETDTLVFTEKHIQNKPKLTYIRLNFDEPILDAVLEELYTREILSLMVEGGRKLLQSFINNGLWDEARIFMGNKDFKNGIKAPEIHANSKSFKQILNDSLVICQNR
ncbi:MAG: bifunctional diaminohydroxyphosphoribosylaminopyrimidine deaminase/5-amino-6-(5-phosphoribosylamino)uracil reductase RibD [Bacteroidales bacterium]|nr:bifunctional diaminohydroxyphosphoribosylaminopyrimidine deaminase/5-amino-6-(5-phosphoribosylamino)uracil reductase RibD [Bacteroidales bacterium]MBN2821269.1 bifunctional diaminohydroxyphosphoribosylaminopyrimidine deaminase/5-amino-6-(5-phosphoribosylamino)uracil reductase RibD [Bacteroidales bacterium]